MKKHPDNELFTVTCNLAELHTEELMGLLTTMRRKIDKLSVEFEERLDLLFKERGVSLKPETPNIQDLPSFIHLDSQVFRVSFPFVKDEDKERQLAELREQIPEADFYIHDDGYLYGQFPPELLKPRIDSQI